MTPLGLPKGENVTKISFGFGFGHTKQPWMLGEGAYIQRAAQGNAYKPRSKHDGIYNVSQTLGKAALTYRSYIDIYLGPKRANNILEFQHLPSSSEPRSA